MWGALWEAGSCSPPGRTSRLDRQQLSQGRGAGHGPGRRLPQAPGTVTRGSLRGLSPSGKGPCQGDSLEPTAGARGAAGVERTRFPFRLRASPPAASAAEAPADSPQATASSRSGVSRDAGVASAKQERRPPTDTSPRAGVTSFIARRPPTDTRPRGAGVLGAGGRGGRRAWGGRPALHGQRLSCWATGG